ncbi:MAG: hypothetical protein ABW321_04845 [Polyangiales bacterium]
MSPPRGLSTAEWQALEAHGEVVAWRATTPRLPEPTSAAPPCPLAHFDLLGA